MDLKNHTKTIVALVSDDSWLEINIHAKKTKEFIFKRGLNPVKNGIKSLNSFESDLIIIDTSFGDQFILQLIGELIAIYPSVPVVVILDSNQIEMIQSVTLVGARSFILKPFTEKNLFVTIKQVIALQSKFSPTINSRIEAPESGGQTVAVYSPRGGVGCTTIASNLALALLDKTDEKILLIDGKSFFGHLGVIFNLQSSNTIADIIPHANELDEKLIKSVIVKHASGLNILKGPDGFSTSQNINPEVIYNILVAMQKYFPYMIIDNGSSLDENTVTYLDFATKILIPINPEMNSLRDGREFSRIALSILAYEKSKLLYVINNHDINGGINPQYLSNALEIDPIAKIPYAEGIVLRSINRGVPILIKNKKHKFSKAIYDMADIIINKLSSNHSSIQSNINSPADSNDILAQTSRLG